MLQLCRETDLALETLRAERRRELGMQDLDGDFAVVLDVVRQEDGRHSAPPKLAHDLVPALERSLQAREDVRCGRLGIRRFEQGGLQGKRREKLVW